MSGITGLWDCNIYKSLYPFIWNVCGLWWILWLFKFYNLKIKLLKDSNCFKSLDIVLIGGASIIEEEKIKKNLIINCHSGLIPETRGLDSLKWAIFNNKKVAMLNCTKLR